VRWYVASCPQLGHSNSAPPTGKSGFSGKKKFGALESSIGECVNGKLQFAHFKVHRAIKQDALLLRCANIREIT
jgi:hypothetical protein